MDKERVVERGQDGRWNVRAPDSTRASSYHERQEDALARAKTTLKQAGGGRWSVVDDSGREINSGLVE
jgi:Uncharacterized protein conserved in bacteria (DUF2188)